MNLDPTQARIQRLKGDVAAATMGFILAALFLMSCAGTIS